MPPVVVRESQFPPLGVVTAALMVKTVELCPDSLDTVIYCGDTLAPTDGAEKVSEGDVDEPPLAVTVMVFPLLLPPTAMVTCTV